MDRILGYSFHRLVREKGWVAFRELQYTICKRFARRKRSLICLGGGTVRYEWNMDLLRGTGRIVLLTAALEELARRVRAADRPRVNVGTTLEEDLRAIWSESEEKYRRAADLTCDTDGKSVALVVADLKPALRDYLSDPVASATRIL
jgi:shikimate kinase